MTKLCGTCGFCYIKSKRDNNLPTMGYCYGNPPGQGRLRPQVRLDDVCCSLYQKAESSNRVLSRSSNDD